MTNPTPDPKAEHLATIDWTRGKWSHVKGKYAREHTWHLAGGSKLKATDAPILLPDSYRDKTHLNPENLFVATIASAHMLSWLHIAFHPGGHPKCLTPGRVEMPHLMR